VDNPQNEFELQKNDNINEEIKDPVFQRCIVGLLINSYINGICPEPPQVRDYKRDWIGEDESNYMKKFTDEFAITNDVKDFIESKDIEDWICGLSLGITMKKLGAELKRYCIVRKFDFVESKVKSIEGKKKRVWFGIKRREDDEEDVQEVIPKNEIIDTDGETTEEDVDEMLKYDENDDKDFIDNLIPDV